MAGCVHGCHIYNATQAVNYVQTLTATHTNLIRDWQQLRKY